MLFWYWSLPRFLAKDLSKSMSASDARSNQFGRLPRRASEPKSSKFITSCLPTVESVCLKWHDECGRAWSWNWAQLVITEATASAMMELLDRLKFRFRWRKVYSITVLKVNEERTYENTVLKDHESCQICICWHTLSDKLKCANGDRAGVCAFLGWRHWG